MISEVLDKKVQLQEKVLNQPKIRNDPMDSFSRITYKIVQASLTLKTVYLLTITLAGIITYKERRQMRHFFSNSSNSHNLLSRKKISIRKLVALKDSLTTQLFKLIVRN